MVELRSNLDWAGEFQTMAERMRLCESEEQMYNALRKFKEQIFSSELKNFAQIVVASIRGDMMNNSIDRQLAIDTAIDAVDSWDGGCNKEREKIIREALEKLPSAQPEIVRCGQCKYAEVADSEDSQDGYTCQFHRGSIWFSGSYCSWAERRTDECDC